MTAILKSTGKPSGVIFDFDGVLVNSLELHLRAWRDASFELFGRDIKDSDRLGGMATKQISKTVALENNAPEKAAELSEVKQRLLIENISPVPLLPGSLEVFEALKKLEISFGIASNTPRKFLENSILNSGLRTPGAIVGIDEVKNPKPAPDPYLLCAKKLGFSELSSVLVFEDSRHGLGAAISAEMFAIGIASRHSHSELLSWGARLCFDHLLDALQKNVFTEFTL